MAEMLQYFDTDETGSFVIPNLAYGTYSIGAKKEDEGYPESLYAFYGGKPLPTATLSPDQPTANVTVKLGPRAAILTGTVRDAETGKPIPSGFDLRRTAHPEQFMGTSQPPHFRVLIPPATDISVEVSGEGYETWPYPEASGTPPSPFHLASATQLNFDVLLRPKADRPKMTILLPEGATGWFRIEGGMERRPPAFSDGDTPKFTFRSDRVLETSSPLPPFEAKRDYFFYSRDGVIRPAPDYWNGEGLFWGEYICLPVGSRSCFGFFVGAEAEYEKHKNAPH